MNKQSSFLSLAHAKKLRCEQFLDAMQAVIPWDRLLAEIHPLYPKKETGRKKTDLTLLVKTTFLQQWYNLSDPAAEEAIYDRNSFQKFLGIDLLAHTVPDETTILHFRHFLEEHGLQERLFAIVNALLAEKHLLMKTGSIVDATIIAAPASTKNTAGERDPEMHQTQKGNQWYFGMKAHIGVDARSGLVHTVRGTSANVHDRTVFPDLLHGAEDAVFGDSAYGSDDDKRAARAGDLFWGIADRRRRNRSLSSAQKQRNHHLASVRAKVEHPFQVLKCVWHHTKVRYRGLRKNTLHLTLLFTLVNLFRVRKQLLALV